MNFPDEIGPCIDLFYELRSERIELEKQAKKLKEQQDALEDHIFDRFDKQGLEGSKGKKATAAITRKQVPNVTDALAFEQFIRETQQFDLVTIKPRYEACRERWDSGEVVPGVEPFEKLGLSVTKR